jgi:Ca-activated chloride channel family protein
LLVIDRSGSMRGQAWVDTQQAATHFVSLLGPDDQAGLVSFAAQVNVDMQLTYNHTAVASAIARLGLGSGTNIAAGVSAATQALRDTHRPGGAVAAMIVLTDGVTKGGEDAARAAATAAKQAGVRVLTIGLGSEVNATLLTEMASAPHDYHPAPSSSDLDKIYRSIAETLPCERSN